MTTRTRFGALTLTMYAAYNLHIGGVGPRQRRKDERVAVVLKAVNAGADGLLRRS